MDGPQLESGVWLTVPDRAAALRQETAEEGHSAKEVNRHTVGGTATAWAPR